MLLELPHAPEPEISGPVQVLTLTWVNVVVPQTAMAVWGVMPGVLEQGDCANALLNKQKNKKSKIAKRISSLLCW